MEERGWLVVRAEGMVVGADCDLRQAGEFLRLARRVAKKQVLALFVGERSRVGRCIALVGWGRWCGNEATGSLCGVHRKLARHLGVGVE